MPLERIALVPKCQECEAVWLPADEERWRAYLTDDEPSEVVFYCLSCAEREVPLVSRGANTDTRSTGKSAIEQTGASSPMAPRSNSRALFRPFARNRR